MPDIRTETMTVNMGPQHPSTHGVLRLVLELDGETVLSASPTIGYLHTGIEKTCEQKKWQQVIPLVERMDYLSAQSNSMCFCLSVEKLLGVELPDRVREMSAAPSSTFRCRDTAGIDMAWGAVSSVTVASCSASWARIARRVGSASAENTMLSWSVPATHRLI